MECPGLTGPFVTCPSVDPNAPVVLPQVLIDPIATFGAVALVGVVVLAVFTVSVWTLLSMGDR